MLARIDSIHIKSKVKLSRDWTHLLFISLNVELNYLATGASIYTYSISNILKYGNQIHH